MMAVITLSALYAEAVVRGEGVRVKILLQCTTLHSELGGVKITLHIYSLDFSSLLMTTA